MSIPVEICASQALGRDARYAGKVDAAGLERLRDLAPEDVEAELGLSIDSSRRGWISGRIGARLRLTCQFCLEPFVWPVAIRLRLALARNEEEEERLMADCEPLLVSEDRLMLHDIIEDELLLAVPMMPKCPACENERPPQGETPPPPADRPGSLAALKNLSLKGVTPARRK